MRLGSGTSFRSHLILLTALLLISAGAVSQEKFVPSRINGVVDEAKLTTLKHNTHPLALPQFDRGRAPATLPMNRMLLVLKRTPEQEDALRELLDAQQDKTNPRLAIISGSRRSNLENNSALPSRTFTLLLHGSSPMVFKLTA